MNTRILTSIAAVILFAWLSIPARLAAQEQKEVKTNTIDTNSWTSVPSVVPRVTSTRR